MALAALHWTLDKLSQESGVPRIAVARFQSANHTKPVNQEHVDAMQQAFERAGVQFSRKSARLIVSVPE